ncbi:hypothetical protein BT63DRAFT_460892 [Microthyrium microscopicum]|uniref:YCII-related domain-containing protein n=1 Tax=Microthyrium microscopicum TaxID=703497 RepID=A0A6A6TY40_9PEZI|nr:hypothetical protein BT63DRAFT_460892 [Microthyrium microscopicum]
MSSAAPKTEWLVMVPDKPNALQKRLEVRAKHLENITPAHKEGNVPMGGAYLAEPPKEGETPKMLGSAMVFLASSKEEVVERLRGDIYTTSGVWDVDNAQIWPFKTAIRSGL